MYLNDNGTIKGSLGVFTGDNWLLIHGILGIKTLNIDLQVKIFQSQAKEHVSSNVNQRIFSIY
jgi:hypothetical protein